MKRNLSLWILILSMLGCQSTTTLLFKEDQDLKIWVATDIHYMHQSMVRPSDYVHDLMLKADGKLIKYIPEITQAFVDKVIEEQPDLLILSGDLSFNGEKTNHQELSKLLHKIQKNQTQVLVLPGNHDIDSLYPIQLKEDGFLYDDSVSKEEFVKIYQEFGFKQAISKSPVDLTYLVQINPKLFILMLDDHQYSATNDPSVDINQGVVRQETLTWISNQLETIKDAQLMVVLHHNLLTHNPKVSLSTNLLEAAALKSTLKEHLNLVLSGHIHLQNIAQEEGITEIVTSSLALINNQYGTIHYRANQAFEYQVESVDVGAWAKRQKTNNPELINFKEFSFETMRYVNMRRTAFRLLDQGMDEDLALKLAEFDGYLKAFYFPANFTQSTQALRVLPEALFAKENDPQFYYNNLEYLMESADLNQRHIVVPLKVRSSHAQ